VEFFDRTPTLCRFRIVLFPRRKEGSTHERTAKDFARLWRALPDHLHHFDPGAGPVPDNRIYAGALLELILIIANIGTAVVLIPLLKRQNEILTFG
jgi:hypothetical protein